MVLWKALEMSKIASRPFPYAIEMMMQREQMPATDAYETAK